MRRWSRIGTVIILLKYSEGVEAGVFGLWRWRPHILGIDGVVTTHIRDGLKPLTVVGVNILSDFLEGWCQTINCTYHIAHTHFLATTARFKEWEAQCVYRTGGYTEDILAAVPFVLPDILLAPSKVWLRILDGSKWLVMKPRIWSAKVSPVVPLSYFKK